MVGSGSRLKRRVRATLKPSSPGGMGASAARSMRRSAAMWAKGLDESGRNFAGGPGFGAVVRPTSAKRTGWPASQRGPVPFRALRSMRDLHAIVEGIVQGLTEFLPISSTAHLRIVPAFFGWPDPGAAFTAVVQLGTMAAGLLYFPPHPWGIPRARVPSLTHPAHPGDPHARLGWY